MKIKYGLKVWGMLKIPNHIIKDGIEVREAVISSGSPIKRFADIKVNWTKAISIFIKFTIFGGNIFRRAHEDRADQIKIQ